MSEDRHKYDDLFREKLENHESSVPDNLFERLMSDRAMRGQLGNYDSVVSESLFDKLMRDREGSDEMPSDAPLRERMLDHETAVPKHIFNEVIAERERRRRALIWRSAAVLALLFVAYFMFIKNEAFVESQKEKSNNEQKVNKQNEVNDNKPVVINNEKNDNGIVKTQNSETKNSMINKNQQAKNITASTAALTTLATNVSSDLKVANATKTVSNSTNYNSTTVSTEIAATQQTIIPTTNFSSGLQAAVSDFLNNKDTKGEEQNAGSDKLLKSDNTVPFNIADAQNTKLDPQNAKNMEHLDKIGTEGVSFEPKRTVFDFENLSILKIKTFALPTPDLKKPCAASPDPDKGCPTFGKRRRGNYKAIYVDVFGAPEYAFRRFSQNLPESVAYLNARDSVEKPWYAFSAGARVSLVFKNGLALRTGAIYAQTNEIAVFDSLGIGKKTTETNETYIPRLGGGFDTILTRKTTYQQGIFRTTRHNRYRSIDIPVQLGFEFPLNDYWTFSVNGGANFNISAAYKTYYLTDKFKQDSIKTGFGETNSVFQPRLGISLFGSVAAYRQLTGNLQLVFEPSVRYYLKPITRADYALKQAYTNAGLMVGLRYRF
jgi:hypothetical protein